MYQLTTTDTILRLEDGAVVPPDLANVDFQRYLEWVAAGNEPEPAPEPESAPALTPAEKLAAAGLTVAELRELLGLNAGSAD